MLLFALTIIALGLTVTMFASRQMLLGFPSLIFWAILSGHSYNESIITWDVYYFIFFASMGMAIFCAVAMYALRTRDLSGPDADEGTFFDEGKGPDLQGNVEQSNEDEASQPSPRVQALHDRAAKRRSDAVQGKKRGWREY